jgi:hypothetical protein
MGKESLYMTPGEKSLLLRTLRAVAQLNSAVHEITMATKIEVPKKAMQDLKECTTSIEEALDLMAKEWSI